MLIICPSCATAYQVELSSLGANGRQVRCARCRTVWLATAESAVAEAVADPAPSGSVIPPPVSPPSVATKNDGGESDWSTSAAVPQPEPDIAMSDAPPLVPSQDARTSTTSSATAVDGDDIETIAARRARSAQRPGRQLRLTVSRPGLPATILILVAILAGLMTWRATVVRVLPQTASLFAAIGLPVNVRGLTFEDLRTTHELTEGTVVLVVEGVIANVTRVTVDVPRLRFALRNAAGQEVYAWTALPTRSMLEPQEQLQFQTRLASPPSDGRDVVVRFFTRHDLIAGAH